MKKLRTLSALFCAALLVFSGCGTSPKNGATGELIVHNQAGVELAFYVNQAYKKTAKAGEQFTVMVDGVDTAGTIVTLGCFLRDKISNVSVYPNDQSAKYYSFPNVIDILP
jgi:cysteine synthase